MPEKSILCIKGIVQVVLVIIIHLGIIHFLGMKTEEWEGVGKREILISYCCPLFLLVATCAMALRTKKIWYNVVWLTASLVPSSAVLYKLKEAAEVVPTEPVFIEFHFAQGYLELMFFFPFIYSVIQILLLIAMWIMIASKEDTKEGIHEE